MRANISEHALSDLLGLHVCVCVCVYLGGLAGDSDERNCNRRPPAGVEP